jgi:Ca2+-binding EF-hand superfamily protein
MEGFLPAQLFADVDSVDDIRLRETASAIIRSVPAAPSTPSASVLRAARAVDGGAAARAVAAVRKANESSRMLILKSASMMQLPRRLPKLKPAEQTEEEVRVSGVSACCVHRLLPAAQLLTCCAAGFGDVQQPNPESIPTPRMNDFGPKFRSRARWHAKHVHEEEQSELERRWYQSRNLKLPFSFSRRQRKHLKNWFDFIDRDGSGEITGEELLDPLLSTGIVRNWRDVEALLAAIDSNGNGTIDFEEFLMVLRPPDGEGNAGEADAQTAFSELQVCGAGAVCYGAVCCAVLCCAVLCCAVLCCAVLCCAVLCCAVLCCAVLCCTACVG